jgi:hypothetical protein
MKYKKSQHLDFGLNEYHRNQVQNSEILKEMDHYLSSGFRTTWF